MFFHAHSKGNCLEVRPQILLKNFFDKCPKIYFRLTGLKILNYKEVM